MWWRKWKCWGTINVSAKKNGSCKYISLKNINGLHKEPITSTTLVGIENVTMSYTICKNTFLIRYTFIDGKIDSRL